MKRKSFDLGATNLGSDRSEENEHGNFDIDKYMNKYKDLIPKEYNCRGEEIGQKCNEDFGGCVYVSSMSTLAARNQNFRKSIWTGKHLQCTLMNIEKGKETGNENHANTDQHIRIESGKGVLIVGDSERNMKSSQLVCAGDAIFIPAGTWHNIRNTGKGSLKISSIYAPPHNEKCTLE